MDVDGGDAGMLAQNHVMAEDAAASSTGVKKGLG